LLIIDEVALRASPPKNYHAIFREPHDCKEIHDSQGFFAK
jgi:hypothetical protein